MDMEKLAALELDEVTREISSHFHLSVKQVTGSAHRGGHNWDVTVEFYGQSGQYTYHMDKMPGLGWQVIGYA